MKWSLAALALAVLAAPLVWRLSAPLSPPPLEEAQQARLVERVEMLSAELDALAARVAALERGEAAPTPEAAPGAEPSRFGGFDELMLLSERRGINAGLTPLGIGELSELFGMPAPELGQDCAQPTSPRLLGLLETRDVGPFRAQMIRPALDSVERVFARVREEWPDLFAQLRSYGGLCARLIRGSEDSISRHAFGVALDVSIGGTLDAMGDGKTQFGLIILRDFFHEEGWIWGAAFGREDSMHFEVSRELLAQWREIGLLDVETAADTR